jgi:ferredoxin-NADP reductase
VDQRCGRCHSLDRVYKTSETPQEWSATVARMVSYAAGSAGAIQPGEDQQIIAYLSATQTPDAVNQRQAATQASAASGGMVAQDSSEARSLSKQRTRYDGKMIGFVSLVCLCTLALVIRRPSRIPVTTPKVKPNAGPPQVRADATRIPASARSGPMILKLISITAQTLDSKTLRFAVDNDHKLNARPGQFLNFCFLFDGKKAIRSYSICSSSARSGYIEITIKRVKEGCVSVFLNDRAALGMTVEAEGPFGNFCFEASKHHNVFLLAAGSGITPMMAMLRYIDDLCLQTNVTLLYCVRTGGDIMFESELNQLQSRLKSFEYVVLLSQPHAEWAGRRGHISR